MVEEDSSKSDNEFFKAAIAGDVQTVTSLLDTADLKATDGDGWTVLHLVVKAQNRGLTRLILEHPQIDVNASDNEGWTALHLAVQEQSRNLVRQLLEHPEIDVNAKNKWQSTPLMLAVTSGNIDIVESLLRHPKIKVDLKADYYGRTALMQAAVKGHAHIARYLVTYGANVNVSDKTGRNNALIEAIKNRNFDIAIYLLRTGTIDFSNRELRLQSLIWASRHRKQLYNELDHAIAVYFNRFGGHPNN
ncbi:MAG: ankyrin repeat domain-containing protein [Rhodobacteraceae bacterium]|nr:ankyrin repeat domain-containing protein [Paracoccaceae bacterium]MYF45753.1 ankyrin repeat domain-containing protein [Paracoccaceae bacterium]MYI90851.1 ankyrin repeat domain-containing protein [Paracoccaceae bacterium]